MTEQQKGKVQPPRSTLTVEADLSRVRREQLHFPYGQGRARKDVQAAVDEAGGAKGKGPLRKKVNHSSPFLTFGTLRDNDSESKPPRRE